MCDGHGPRLLQYEGVRCINRTQSAQHILSVAGRRVVVGREGDVGVHFPAFPRISFATLDRGLSGLFQLQFHL